MPPLIQFDHVTYRHPGSVDTTPPALNDISISIEKGEWVAIVGANGSGKTTFARHCNALLLPSHGRVRIDSKDSAERANLPHIRSRVGMVFQNPEDQIVATLIEEDTAFGPENLAVPPAEIRERVAAALETVKMTGHREQLPHLLSAGQKQRVALAGVLAMQPECVIFDESTAMLDPRGRLDVLAEMQSLHNRGITVLFITHFMEEAARADRVLALNSGDLVFDGTPKDLFADLQLLRSCGLEQPSTIMLLNEIRSLNPQLSGLPADFEQVLAGIPQYAGSYVRPPDQPAPAPGETLIEVEGLNHTYLLNTPLAHQSLFRAYILVGLVSELFFERPRELAGGILEIAQLVGGEVCVREEALRPLAPRTQRRATRVDDHPIAAHAPLLRQPIELVEHPLRDHGADHLLQKLLLQPALRDDPLVLLRDHHLRQPRRPRRRSRPRRCAPTWAGRSTSSRPAATRAWSASCSSPPTRPWPRLASWDSPSGSPSA